MSTTTPAAPGAGQRRRPSREEVRRALLDAAARVFARQGIDAASVDDVAADAGFTKGAVYSNFGSKDALVAALVEDRVSAYLELGLEAVADPALSLTERAHALGDRLTRAGDEQRDWHLLFLELWQRAVRSGSLDGVFLARRRELHAAVTLAIEGHLAHADGAASPSSPAFAPAELATLLMGLANGFALERLVDPASVPDDLFGRVLAAVMAG
ncbi:MAG: putative Transcriptional regulator, TetR family [Marmoricola sp.]|nr:putative Transcriptional regulator, TetR family [Marmoricola sp.]